MRTSVKMMQEIASETWGEDTPDVVDLHLFEELADDLERIAHAFVMAAVFENELNHMEDDEEEEESYVVVDLPTKEGKS